MRPGGELGTGAAVPSGIPAASLLNRAREWDAGMQLHRGNGVGWPLSGSAGLCCGRSACELVPAPRLAEFRRVWTFCQTHGVAPEPLGLDDPCESRPTRVFCDSLTLMKCCVMRNIGISRFGTNEQVNEEHLCKV